MMSAWGLVASMLVQAVATIMFMVAVGTVVFLFLFDDVVTGRRRR